MRKYQEYLGIKDKEAVNNVAYKTEKYVNKDVSIRKGENISNIGIAEAPWDAIQNRPKFATFRHQDSLNYEGYYAAALKLNFKDYDVYKYSLNVKKDIKIPSHKNQVGLFYDFYNQNKDDVSATLGEVYSIFDKSKTPKTTKEWQEIIQNEFPKSMMQKDAYITFITGYCTPSKKYSKTYNETYEKFNNFIKENGYNGILDENDRLNNSYMLANSPIILLDPVGTLEYSKPTVISKEEIYNNMVKYNET